MAIKAREARLREITAAGALQPDAWCDEDPVPISRDDLHRQLVPSAILLNVEGGADITYHADNWDGNEIIVTVNIKGFCEDVWVYR